MRYTTFLIFAFALMFAACGGEGDYGAIECNYDEAKAQLAKAKQEVEYLPETIDRERYEALMEEVDALGVIYDIDGDAEEVKRCQELQGEIDLFRESIPLVLNSGKHNFRLNVLTHSDYLIENTEAIPVYVRKGETLKLEMEFEKKLTVTLYNGDSHSVIKTYKNKSELNDSMTARFSAVYLVEIAPKSRTYVNATISLNGKSPEIVTNIAALKLDTVLCEKKDFRAMKVEGIEMQNLLEEPRKFTLRGQLKAAFSGSSRAIVALQIPKGTKDVLYSLRVSTNETPASSDGEFYKNMDLSYRKVKFFGLPVYESQRSIGLINTLLGENVPPREEDAYINMYVFMSADEARKFQNKVPVDQIKYHIDYSTIGTQSCNGRIPVSGQKTIYLGFENERMRYNNYVWLEAIGSVQKTEYFQERYLPL